MGRAPAPFVDVADDLLEQVLDRDEAGRAAVLIHDDGHLRAKSAHRGKHLRRAAPARHVRQRPGISRRDRLVRDQCRRISLMCRLPMMLSRSPL